MRKMAALIAAVAFLTAVPFLGVSKGAPVELKISHHGASVSKNQEIMKAGADWIEKRFGDRIKVTIYPSQTLLNAANAFDGTANGIADISLVIPGWTQGRFPKSEVLDLPPAIPSAVDATNVYYEFYKKFLTDEWKAVKVLGVHVQVPQSIHTKRKPIRTLQDMKGEKFRIYGIGKDIMNAFGGIPVAMPMPEAYEAIRQGIVSGIMVPFAEMKSYRLIDVCFYHTQADIMASPFFIVMNLKKYNALPADIKKAFDEELPPYWNSEAGKIWNREEQTGIEEVKKTAGHEFITLSAADRKLWNERAKTINGPWAQALEAKGLPGKMLIAEKYKAIEKYLR
ncbi:MAG TPA: TRAP transporter substrate-binding protein [Syntrophales bacterium]